MATTIFDKVLQRNEFADRPPVLVDLGASGEIHAKWRPIAKYCVCLAFDADQRKMGYISRTDSGFKMLHVYSAIVTDRPEKQLPFYLTKSPFCSSLLQPNPENLANYWFAPMFELTKTVELPAVTLGTVLSEVKIPAIDWFKCDTQGTDLRLFKSLGEDLMARVLVAEFEPGFIDFYQGEDNVHDVLGFMQNRPFFMSEFHIPPMAFVRPELMPRLTPAERKRLPWLAKNAPGWAEMTFLNTLRGAAPITQREWLLAWVFATVEEQNTFALDIAARAAGKFSDPIFAELQEESLRRIHRVARRRMVNYVFSRVWKKLTRLFGCKG